MSNRQAMWHGWDLDPRTIRVVGSFVPLTGAGTIDATKVTGFGFGFALSQSTGVVATKAQPQNNPTPLTTPGIVRANTGLYTITTEDPYLELVAFHCDLAGPVGGTALWIQPVEPVANLATAGKGVAAQVLIVNSSGTPTDANANMRVYFGLAFRDSTVGFRKP